MRERRYSQSYGRPVTLNDSVDRMRYELRMKRMMYRYSFLY